MLPGEFEVGSGFLERTKETLAAAFNLLVGSGGANGSEGVPVLEIEWIEGVDQEFFET